MRRWTATAVLALSLGLAPTSAWADETVVVPGTDLPTSSPTALTYFGCIDLFNVGAGPSAALPNHLVGQRPIDHGANAGALGGVTDNPRGISGAAVDIWVGLEPDAIVNDRDHHRLVDHHPCHAYRHAREDVGGIVRMHADAAVARV